MTNDFHNRAAAIFGTREGTVAWPYGLETPHPRRSGLSRERLAKATAHAEAAQHTIVEWAERHGLRYSRTGCCQLWLLRKVSRTCPIGTCRNNGGRDYVWLDHVNGWLRDSRPAALTSAPYATEYDAEHPEIRECLATDERLRAAFGPGWYGHGTKQIVLWRTDRIDDVEPAALPS
ncbi:hypothetical protein [Streptomyces sp. ECR3.8]|uniref:hypothetical protein n=1 Tax=Streptomyces sp. ECR3.8 TaxID=3461009 RepID=UPI004042FE29